MSQSGFSEPAFGRIAELAHLVAGLSFPANRQPSAEAGMRRAMASLRITDPEQLLRAAETPGTARDTVLAELTVGESYFFRDSSQLALLTDEIIPERRGSYGPERPFRVWCAGCASGEEPYSVAILLRELGWPHPAWILGTDVALPRLNSARRGRYTRWALRGVSDERVNTWFTRAGTYFDVDPTIRDAVEFRALNLVQDNYPAEKFDLVLCRNVMIYFDMATVARIATGLLESLAPDGWLVLGASDPPLANLVACEAVMTRFGMAYRRRGRAARIDDRVLPFSSPADNREWNRAPVLITEFPHQVTEPSAVPPPSSSPLFSAPVAAVGKSEILQAYELADYERAESLLSIAVATELEDESNVALWILYVRTVANQGRLHDAGELCARGLEIHPLSAELHYLHATLLAQANWHVDAANAARRAIYLDRRFVMGHLQLGDSLTRTGDSRGARLAFENAMMLLEQADPSDSIAAADGVPASRLRQIATLRLSALPPLR